MGHRNSKAISEAIKKLSSLELHNIKAVFNELSTENKDGTHEIPEPNLATRRVFAERFSLPGLIGERLFHAFDRDNNGAINLEEFVGGVALCLHGSAHAKCELLFRMFNFSDDEEDAVTEDELKTVLLSSLQSANTVLDTAQDSAVAESKENEKPLIETVAEIVEDAFKTCDKSKNGKLSAKEFSTWLHKNPKIMDNVFGWQCPKPELGQWANEKETSGVLADKGSAKSLQDLFGGTQGSQDLSGEKFFDSLGVSSEAVEDESVEEINKSGLEKPGIDHPLVENASALDTNSVVSNGAVSGQDIEGSHPSLSDNSDKHQPSSPLQLYTTNDAETCFPDTNGEAANCGYFDHYAAMWMPSGETISFLEAVQSGIVKPENIKLPNMAVPCLAIDVPQLDPVKELIAKIFSGQEDVKRSVPTESTVSCDESGLKQLLNAECWGAALNLTAKLLEKNGHGLNVTRVTHSAKSLEIWFCRIALLFQLKMFSFAEVELQAFGNLDSAKLYYEFHPDLYPGKKGSMVPFAFRILNAVLPQHTGRPKESLDKLFYVHSICREILKSLHENCDKDIEHDQEEYQKGIQLWEKRLIYVLYCIGNTFVSLKEYRLAISVFKQIAKKDLDNSRALLSGIGRISLQSGDIESAQFHFKSVEDMISSESNSQPDVLINKGLLALTLDAYEEAYKHFLAAKNIDPENSVAINNAAVSLLFQGRLKEALELLEDIVLKSPERNLQEGILFNICTMYELETSHHVQKKEKMLELIAKYKGDGFNVSCLKFS